MGKWSWLKAASCTGSWQIDGTGIVVPDGVEHVVVVDARAMSHLEKLVGDRELHVAPGVREELGELGLPRARAHDLDVQAAEELAGPFEGRVRDAPDQLRERADLLERVALGHPLRAEGDVGAKAVALQASG